MAMHIICIYIPITVVYAQLFLPQPIETKRRDWNNCAIAPTLPPLPLYINRLIISKTKTLAFIKNDIVMNIENINIPPKPYR